MLNHFFQQAIFISHNTKCTNDVSVQCSDKYVYYMNVSVIQPLDHFVPNSICLFFNYSTSYLNLNCDTPSLFTKGVSRSWRHYKLSNQRRHLKTLMAKQYRKQFEKENIYMGQGDLSRIFSLLGFASHEYKLSFLKLLFNSKFASVGL